MLTQEEINDFAYSVRRKYQDEQAELKGGMCEHIMFDAMEIQKGVLLGVEYAQSKMYSEEDMKNAYCKGARNGSNAGMRVARGGEMNLITFDKWFETIKKK